MVRVVRRIIAFGVEVEPPLLLGIPDHVEALQAPRFGLQHVLLQRFDPDHGMDRVIGGDPVDLGHADAGLAVVAKAEPRFHVALVKGRAVEVRDYVSGLRFRPRQRVMRLAPVFTRLLVTGDAGFGPQIAAVVGQLQVLGQQRGGEGKQQEREQTHPAVLVAGRNAQRRPLARHHR